MQDGNRRRFRASHGERDPEDALEMSRHLDAAGRRADGYVRAHPRQVAEVMTPDPFTMDEDSLPEHVVGAWSRSISSAGTIPRALSGLERARGRLYRPMACAKLQPTCWRQAVGTLRL